MLGEEGVTRFAGGLAVARNDWRWPSCGIPTTYIPDSRVRQVRTIPCIPSPLARPAEQEGPWRVHGWFPTYIGGPEEPLGCKGGPPATGMSQSERGSLEIIRVRQSRDTLFSRLDDLTYTRSRLPDGGHLVKGSPSQYIQIIFTII